jgi:hypothetical protein
MRRSILLAMRAVFPGNFHKQHDLVLMFGDEYRRYAVHIDAALVQIALIKTSFWRGN